MLEVDLVPSSCWFNNVRSHVTKKVWESLRMQVFLAADNICEICKDPNSAYSLECHEVWQYDDKKLIQKLTDLVALCPACHTVKHFGLAELQGKKQEAFKHLMKINGWSKKNTEKYLADVFMQWADRSSKSWKLDISYLQKYGINTHKIKQ